MKQRRTLEVLALLERRGKWLVMCADETLSGMSGAGAPG
jgi:hypothetical protein